MPPSDMLADSSRGTHLILPAIIHEDDRGSFANIPFQLKWSEMNFVTSVSGCVRGQHFHMHSTELFVMIEGRICVDSAPVNVLANNSYQTGQLYSKEFKSGDIFCIKPLTWHRFSTIEDTVWFSMMSEPHTGSNLDIVKLEIGNL